MAVNWMKRLIEENTVSEAEYSNYLRLELRKRAIEAELKSIEKQQTYLGAKIKSIWQRDEKKVHRLGNATFFLKNNLIVLKNLGVEEQEVVQALWEAGYNQLIMECVDWRELRNEIKKLEGELPPELLGVLKVWVKPSLYLRISNKANCPT